MDKIQERLLELLQRIDEVCRENSIKYYLGNETALCAARWGKFAENCNGATVYMPGEDYDRFEQLTIANPQQHTVESMATNPDFPFPFLHYVDKDTTRINLSMIGLQEHPGLAVKVAKLVLYAPLENNEPLKDKMALAASRFEDVFGVPVVYPRSYEESKLQKLKKDRDYALQIYKNDLEKGSDKDRYYLQRYRERARYFKKELFSGEPSKILLEGHYFNIPKDLESFMTVLYGRWWKTDEIEFAPYSDDFVTDMDNSYTLYMSLIEELKEDAHNYRQGKLEKLPILKLSREMRSNIRNEFKYYYRTVDRFYCVDKYFPRKKEVIKLYKKGDFDTLSEILKDYQEITEKHITKTVPFAFDKDYYIILTEVLRRKGQTAIAKAMIDSQTEAFEYLDKINPKNKRELNDSTTSCVGTSGARNKSKNRSYYSMAKKMIKKSMRLLGLKKTNK